MIEFQGKKLNEVEEEHETIERTIDLALTDGEYLLKEAL